MMRKIFYLLMLATVFVACNSDDEYNADGAQSLYRPMTGEARVASLHTTSTIDGCNYSWKHSFFYDKLGRIKEVCSAIKHYERNVSDITNVEYVKECNINSNALYFYNDADIRIEYMVTKEYPEYPSWNNSVKYVDSGKLNGDGFIEYYNASSPIIGAVSFDCSYNKSLLKTINFDSGVNFNILRDANGNVSGHSFAGYDSEGNDSTSVRSGRYKYLAVRNNTNFDFSAYLGYWEHERWIWAMSSWPYAAYQLAAFGFFGSTSSRLPMWESGDDDANKSLSPWEFENGFPVKYTDPDGRVTIVTYEH